jgi:ADP-ribose pyrophosphatase YjhB (NUDIX family)
MKNWDVIESKKIIDNKWIVVEKHKCKIGDEIIDDYYIVKKKDFVILIVEDNEGIYFLEQYRHGVGESIINLPMGLINDDEIPKETAKRELFEETGYDTDFLEYLGEFYMAPSYISTKAHVFYSNSLKKIGGNEMDKKEGELVFTKISKEDVKNMIKNNEIKDMSTIMAIHVAREKLNLV